MSQRREIENRLALYEDLTGILGAMRSFAMAELHRVQYRERAQAQTVKAISETLQAVAECLPHQPQPAHEVWLLFGSVRGFCGSYNEDIVRTWQDHQGTTCHTIVVGERLQSMLPQEAKHVAVPGADGSLDAANTIERIINAIEKVRSITGGPCGLQACVRDDTGTRVERLLPLPVQQAGFGTLPMLNEAPQKVGNSVAQHYLFQQLMALLLKSIRVENHMRLMQMENALQHLERSSEDLRRQRNRIRQEEIVEEIELMLRKG